MDWLEYHLFFENNADMDTILYLLAEYGFEGSYEDAALDVFKTEDGYGYRINDEKDAMIITFAMQRIEDVQWEEWFSSLGWKKTEIVKATEQTGQEWKEMFSSQQITPNVRLIPEWLKSEEQVSESLCIYLEPGAAFGTGIHGTTQDCIRILDELKLTGKHVLDIGSGSGILSILARKMGAKQVYALDNNPSAQMELHKNMRFNGLEFGIESIFGDAFVQPLPKVDVIVSNIGVKENIELLPKFINSIDLGGLVLASGIVEWGEEEFTQEYRKVELQLVQRLQTDEWVTLLFEKRKEVQ